MSRKTTSKSTDSAEDKAGYTGRDSDGRFASKGHDDRYSDKGSLGRDDKYSDSKGTDKGMSGTSSEGKFSEGRGHSTKHIRKSVATSALSQASTQTRKFAFSHDIFSSQEEYDQSVASVVARIKSGAVKARQPDE